MDNKPRNTPPVMTLDLKDDPTPELVVHSPKTPTLSRKLKAVSLDSDPPGKTSLEVSRDVFSMPNTPKKQFKQKLCELLDHPTTSLGSNLKKFASNNSISGSQTLKTLPEVMSLHDFSDGKPSSIRQVKPKGLLERRGSNASLTIDLGLGENKPPPPTTRLHPAKSVSNLNLSSFGSPQKLCRCERRKSQETCVNCIIYESVAHTKIKTTAGASGVNNNNKQCTCCVKSRRKSLSNENLYVPPCGFCQTGAFKECSGSSNHCKGNRKALYPRHEPREAHLLSEEFKLHLEDIQYLQTAGNLLTIDDLKQSCECVRVPKLHEEFWKIPLNLPEKCYVSGSQSRNRYRKILPNESSRVQLQDPSQYIHANYIKGPDYTETAYIATQGPMSHTCDDFWNMVWYTNCKCIVMLTGLVEKGCSKCELYFPLGKTAPPTEKTYFVVKTMKPRDRFTFDSHHNSTGGTQMEEENTVEFEELNRVQFGGFDVRCLHKDTLAECHVRQLEVRREGATRTIHHFWFADWPDHNMANPEQVLRIALRVLRQMALSSSSTNSVEKAAQAPRKKSMDGVRVPLVVHCSAGIGRTGCFLAILNGIQQLRSGGSVDVLAILCSLRLSRGGMVQTAEQYEFIHRVLRLYTEIGGDIE